MTPWHWLTQNVRHNGKRIHVELGDPLGTFAALYLQRHIKTLDLHVASPRNVGVHLGALSVDGPLSLRIDARLPLGITASASVRVPEALS